MNIERTQYIGHYGITFTVLRLIVSPANHPVLATPCLLVVIGLDAQVNGGIGPQRSLSAMVRQFQGG